LTWLQVLRGLRGVKVWYVLCPSRRTVLLSIQPKHSACSTAVARSMPSVLPLRWTTSQIDRSVRPFSASHSRHSSTLAGLNASASVTTCGILTIVFIGLPFRRWI
jgi:hypothetical protein